MKGAFPLTSKDSGNTLIGACHRQRQRRDEKKQKELYDNPGGPSHNPTTLHPGSFPSFDKTVPRPSSVSGSIPLSVLLASPHLFASVQARIPRPRCTSLFLLVGCKQMRIRRCAPRLNRSFFVGESPSRYRLLQRRKPPVDTPATGSFRFR